MAQIITGITQSKVLSNLDTYNHTAGASSMYKVAVRANEIPPSGLIITIQQNGVTKAISSVPAASQSHVELQVVMNCVAADLISVILSSSVAADSGKNVLKAILTINQGST